MTIAVNETMLYFITHIYTYTKRQLFRTIHLAFITCILFSCLFLFLFHKRNLHNHNSYEIY